MTTTSKMNNDIIYICTLNVAEHLFIDEPSYEFVKSCTCDAASSRSSVICNINVDVLFHQGLQNMQHAIDDAQNITSKCQICDALAESYYKYGKHIIIDTSVFSDRRYYRNPNNVKHDLDSVAKTITMNDTNYVLAGVVHYIQYGNVNNGHYIAYAFSGKYWYKYDDLKKKREIVNCTQEINPHVILYVKC